MQTNARIGLPSPKSIAAIVMTLIDDAGNLARHALAFHLQAMLGATVIIGDGFQRIDQDDVEASGALQMM